MTLAELQAMIAAIDPQATKFSGAGTGNYTVWHPYKITRQPGDNGEAEQVSSVQIDRFTKDDPDTIEPLITAALQARADEIAFEHLIDYEQDTGYVHHIWDCEVV